MIYVLILIASAANNGPNVQGVSTIEIGKFRTMNECKDAAKKSERPIPATDKSAQIEFVCVPRGS